MAKRKSQLSSNRKPHVAKGTTPKNERLTIGLVIDDIVLVGGRNALHGVADAAQERDVNLLCFHQRVFQGGEDQPLEMGPASWDALAKVVDGLVIYQSWPSEETFAAFRSRFPSLPMANGLRLYAGCPGLAPDAYLGTKELTCHLIEAHGYRRIAFVAGPEGNWAVEQRYRGYVDALAEHGIPLDPNLVTPHLDWAEAEREAVSLLLDERGLLSGSDFEAVVASNDSIALSMLDEFQSRGVRVPDGVAVVGFDDDSRAACSTPPLTTTRLPSYEIGRQAVEVVLVQIAGEQVPEQTLVPPKMMVRRSCGCQALAVTQAAMTPVLPASKEVELSAALEAQHAQILSAMVEAIGDDDTEGVVTGWVEQVLGNFAAEMEGKAPGMFLTALEGVLGQVMVAGGDASVDAGQRVAAWQGAVSVLRRWVLPYLDGDAGTQAERLWQQAQVMIAVMMEQAQARQALQVEQQAAVLRGVSQALVTTFDVSGLADALAGGLLRLGIPGAYLSLYENPAKPAEWSWLMLAYDEEGRVDLGADRLRFPSPQLVPGGMWPQGQRYSFTVSPLFLRENQLGFILYEMGLQEGTVYDTLRAQISSALQRTLLTEQMARRALQLQTAADVSRTATDVLDLNTLLQQVVELVQKRFDLYYVGLFLVSGEADGAWAVLRAASGEAGARMMERGHRLKVGGESMIGQCIADHRPRIALDVGEEAIRFDNPLLPGTHSEMALPLVTREGAIGALSVQSRERGAFGEAEMAVFETLAGQLANAIASARLYDQALQEILQRRQVEDELRQRTLELEARNAELDAFAHTVAHDLKSPMAGLIGLSTMLESCIDEFSSATVDDLLHRITQAGYKITNIVNALLLLSSLRREEVQGEALDMADIVSEARKRLADLVAERQAEISAPDEWPSAVGYAPWAEEVWVNYISNALKYGGDADEEVSPRIELGFDEMTDLHVRFWVRDNGPGLTPEAQLSLFTPFTRLHQVRAEGHGLGLSIVQRIVEKLGGEVGVESQMGEGSLFYFTLPVAAAVQRDAGAEE